jgi:GntR family transcriptional repressor for pyruvate dehydrogenase complex
MTQKITEKVSTIRLRQAKPVRLFEQAVDQIKKLIVSGHLRPGDKLPSENELSQLLNVSRSSVREALRSLESNGLIQVKSGAGAFVSDDALVIGAIQSAMQRLLTRRNRVLKLLQVRGAIESMLVAQAAATITADGFQHLNAMLERQSLIVQTRPENYLEELATLDMEFHLALCQLGENDIASEIITALLPLYHDDNKAIFYFEKGIALVEEHRRILDALSQHDAHRAEAEMRNHIGRVMEEFETISR